MNKIIKYIPNILSIIRILLIPFILISVIYDKFFLAILLIIIASITDFLDGRIARKYNATSDLGAKLDIVADKLFAGVLMISILLNYFLFVICLIGEILITIINLYSYFKNKKPKTKYIGKIKATSLYITIIIGFISLLYKKIEFLILPFIIITAILQILSIISYIKFAIKTKTP